MILFVCTGNTCRSPLAAALARKAGVDAQSAGLAALPGAPATPQAVRAAARRGADLTGHRARQVNAGMLEAAEEIYVMTESHRAALAGAYPAFQGKIRLLSPAVPDPYGGDDGVYEECVRRLLDALSRAGVLPSA